MGDSILLNTRDAAAFLGVTENTLRQSRVAGKGKLRGVDPPAFVKTGHRSVMYCISELARWRAQFDSVGDSAPTEEPEEPEPAPTQLVELDKLQTDYKLFTGFFQRHPYRVFLDLEFPDDECEDQLQLF